ncbi:MAG: hypothetical protein K2X74_15580 [Acetobacteraceae bacterium]|nr:hypothetical protein [Acetobacteraceae bacterium]
MTAGLAWAARHGGALLAVGVFGGIALAPVAAALREVVTPAVALLMTLVLLRIDPGEVLAWARRPARVALIAAWMLLACPVLAYLAVRAAGLEASLAAGVVLMASSAAISSVPAFARMVGLDPAICLVGMVVTTLLVPFTAPPLALGLLGLDLAISLSGLMVRLALIIGLPALLAVALRRWLGAARVARAGPGLDGATVVVLVVFAFGIMDGVQARLIADPAWVLGGIAVALAANLALNGLTALVLAPVLGRGPALAAGLLAGNRNQALFLAVLPAGADAGVLLFFALGQVPMFVTPALLRPVYAMLRPDRGGATHG